MRVAWVGASLLIGLGVADRAAAQNPVRWSIAADPVRLAAGGHVQARVTADIDDGWKVYALTQPPGGPFALAFQVAAGPIFSAAGAADGPLPHTAFDPNFNLDTQYHERQAAFRVPVRVAAAAAPSTHTLRVMVTFQTCNERLCLPPRELALDVGVIVDGPRSSSARPDAGTHPRGDVAALGAVPTSPTPAARVSSVAAGSSVSHASPGRAGVVRDVSSPTRAATLPAYMTLAAAMGALSLLTPCVFPMVPITVSYFTSHARRRRTDALRQSLLYGLGIVLTFSAVGFAIAVGFGASGLNRLAANPWLNLGITALFLGFALSLFGFWQVAIPARLLTAMSRADAGRGRVTGTMLMGLAFTLTSFTCTAPFLGTLLVVASQGDWQWPLAGMVAFATVFALPFVGLALAPQMAATLPRSGPWLAAVKTSMGLLELAAAVKFLSNADLVWGWRILTRDVVLVIWIVIGVALAAYLAGVLRLDRSARLGRPGAIRFAATAATVALCVWMFSGLTGRRLGELEAFLPPADLTSADPERELPWIINDYERALAEARRANQPLLIDFTGYTCTNCRWMEANMFPRPDVARELARFVRVRLYTDGRGEMYRRFQQLEQDLVGTVALPYYAVLAPDGTPALAFGGLTRSADEFIAFLREGLNP
jgi:thiol:disulfide interchange protein DsbD